MGSLTVDKSAVFELQSATLTVTLTDPVALLGAPSRTLNLSSSNAAVLGVPASVPVPAGAKTVTVVAIGMSPGSATVSVKGQNVSYTNQREAGKSVAVTVKGNQVKSVDFRPQSVRPGGSATGTITLESKAGPDGLRVDLSSARPAEVTVPNFVRVPPGESTATFRADVESDAWSGGKRIVAAPTGSNVLKWAELYVDRGGTPLPQPGSSR